MAHQRRLLGAGTTSSPLGHNFSQNDVGNMDKGIVGLPENATTLQRDIARTLLYFDVFQHPLRFVEIFKFLPSNSVTEDNIRIACSSEPLNKYFVQKNGLVCLNDKESEYIEGRRKKELRARRMWRIAVFMSHLIRRFPFVRGVFISGELSKGVASKKSDIDFFIITASNRVWITRTLFTLFKKTILFNRKTLFCYNHIMSDTNLEITDRNIYTAIEASTLRPLYNLQLYRQFMNANSWIKDYLPNSTTFCGDVVTDENRQPISERILTMLISRKNLDSIDLWLLARWRVLWSRRYNFLSLEKRKELFRCESQVSTAYANDSLTRITQAYQTRLDQFGLTAVGETANNLDTE